LRRSAQNQRIPERKMVKPMQIDGRENICDLRNGDVKLSQQFNFSPGDLAIDPKFARDGDEVFLQHLQRYHAGSAAPVFGH